MAKRWVVDGMNVTGSRPDGWWRDRPEAMRRLTGLLEAFAARTGDEVTVVWDGRAVDLGAEASGVHRLFAPSADDAIAELVAADADRAGLTVVTSDRELASRVRDHGARVTGASGFRRALEAEPAD